MLQLVLLLGFAPASLHPTYLLAYKGRLLQSLTLHRNDVSFVIARTPPKHVSFITKKTTRTAGGLSIAIQQLLRAFAQGHRYLHPVALADDREGNHIPRRLVQYHIAEQFAEVLDFPAVHRYDQISAAI